MKKDIEILSQTFERVIDRKEAIIKSLVKDIEEAEEQYQMALRSHLQNVDGLIGTYYSLFSYCLTNRFHVALHLFSNRSQIMSKCVKNKKVALEPIDECVTDVLATF